MPLLDSKTDKVAAARLKRLFPERRVVGGGARSAAGRRKHSLHHTTGARAGGCAAQTVRRVADC